MKLTINESYGYRNATELPEGVEELEVDIEENYSYEAGELLSAYPVVRYRIGKDWTQIR